MNPQATPCLLQLVVNHCSTEDEDASFPDLTPVHAAFVVGLLFLSCLEIGGCIMGQSTQQSEVEALEHLFWKSIVDRDSEAAIAILCEPALMVSSHGAMKFDHAGYRKMAEDSSYRLLEYTISNMQVLCPTPDTAIATYNVRQVTEAKGKKMEMDVTDSSTWVKVDGKWRCAIHTESPTTAKSG
jgi:ketosteroid isomerase-like protein